jgi:hypothetical protein
VHFANALVNEVSEKEMDLACLSDLELKDALPRWRQMYEDTAEKSTC